MCAPSCPHPRLREGGCTGENSRLPCTTVGRGDFSHKHPRGGEMDRCTARTDTGRRPSSWVTIAALAGLPRRPWPMPSAARCCVSTSVRWPAGGSARPRRARPAAGVTLVAVAHKSNIDPAFVRRTRLLAAFPGVLASRSPNRSGADRGRRRRVPRHRAVVTEVEVADAVRAHRQPVGAVRAK